MTALGQVDGRNIRIELRLAEGHAERFPELALALVREKASVIVASGDAAVRAAQQATETIPIVALVDDMVISRPSPVRSHNPSPVRPHNPSGV